MKARYILPFMVFSSQISIAQTFMTEAEMLETFPGATVSGISNSDGKTHWTQTYNQPKKGKKKGKITGKFGADSYKANWKIKKDKWCETWKGGRACWQMERVGEHEIRLYKKGKALDKLWTLE